MGQMRVYNTATRRWERWEVRPLRMPWVGAWTRMRWLARHLGRYLRAYCRWRWGAERVWDFDPDTLQMRDPKRERRMRRRDRRDSLTVKLVNALKSMIEMQKFIN